MPSAAPLWPQRSMARGNGTVPAAQEGKKVAALSPDTGLAPGSRVL